MKKYAASTVRKTVCAIRMYFLIYDCELLVDRPEVRALVFRKVHAVKPGVTYLPGATYRRMQYYADEAHHNETTVIRSHIEQRWEEYACSLAIDSLAPDPLQLSLYFEALGETYAYQTCANTRNVLSQYFRAKGVIDIARSDAVNQTLDGIRRVKPSTVTRPMALQDLRRILTSFENEGIDIRDKVLAQLLTVGPWSSFDLSYLSWEWVNVAFDRIVVTDPIAKREVTIDTVADDHAFDTRATLLRLMAASGSGPLFQRWDRTGWNGEPIRKETIDRAMHGAARRLGLDRPRLVRAMQLTFRREAATMFGATVVAQHLQLKSSSGLGVAQLQERYAADLIQLREAPAEFSYDPLGGV
jgi:hypothetical protein